jgi:hypothetical protein
VRVSFGGRTLLLAVESLAADVSRRDVAHLKSENEDLVERAGDGLGQSDVPSETDPRREVEGEDGAGLVGESEAAEVSFVLKRGRKVENPEDVDLGT